MLKRYFRAFVFYFLLSILVTFRYQYHAKNAAPHIEDKVASVSTGQIPQAKQNASQPASNYERAWDFAYLVFGWPNGITIWALFITMFAIVEQTIETRRSALATETAAEATSKSVDLMGQQVALQRAERRGVLEVATEEVEVSDMFSEREEWSLLGIIRLTNSGAFPLQIRGGRGGFIFDRSDTLDTVGDFSDLNCEKVWIRPKSRGHIAVLSSPEITDSMSEFWEKMSIDPIEFRLEGTIFYNSLGLNWRRNFAYRWAADYTKALSIKNGFWEENPHGQNDEDQLQDDCPVPF